VRRYEKIREDSGRCGGLQDKPNEGTEVM